MDASQGEQHGERLRALLELSHELGREERNLAILGEGNTSTRLSHDTFGVKASGHCLGTLTEAGVSECRFDKIVPLLEAGELSDAQVDEALLAARVDAGAGKPSTEALFHALLLGLPGVEFVGHVHARAANAILCSPRAREFAENRLFPDEIVCCGAASVLVPYTDPGVPLARAIWTQTQGFVRERGREPRVILLQNHGVIALGRTPQAVIATLLMLEKTAHIFIGAAALGGPVFLSSANVERIAGRPDEHFRQRVLNL